MTLVTLGTHIDVPRARVVIIPEKRHEASQSLLIQGVLPFHFAGKLICDLLGERGEGGGISIIGGVNHLCEPCIDSRPPSGMHVWNALS